MKTKIDSETGEVVAYCDDLPGGPVVTGKDLEEATQKFNEAMNAYRVAMQYIVFGDRLN